MGGQITRNALYDSFSGPFPPAAHRCHHKSKRCLPLHQCGGGGGSPAALPVSPLLFHPSAKGSQILMDLAQRAVKRQASFCNAITFSNRPIALYEQVRLKITKKQSCWSGALRLGFTSKDPSRINPDSLPKYACPDLVSQSGFWAKALPEEFGNEGSVIAFWVDKKGRVFYRINESSPMLFFSGVRTNEPLWALIDVYGLTRGVQLLESEIVPPECLRPRSFTTGRGSSLRREAEESRLSVSLCDLNLQQDDNHLRLAPPAPVPCPIPQNSLNSQQSHLLPQALEGELRFHQVRAANVRTLDDGQTVALLRTEHSGSERALVFTERPLRPGETVFLKVTKSSPARSGALAYGVTSCDPATLRPSDLPGNPEALVDRKEFWAVCRAPQPLQSADILGFLVTADGEVMLSHNGASAGMQVCVDNSRPLWMFFGLHGAISQLRILGWWFVSTAEEQGWVPATYLDSQNGTRDDLELSTTRSGEVTKRRKAHLKRLDRRWTLGGIVNRQQSREEKYVTVQPYTSQGKDEIGFEKGATVEVMQKNLEGWWYIRYQGKEGWAPASYLKKMKEDFSPRKKTLTGPVEIIGNIMEISNLLNKKSVSEKDVQTDGGGGGGGSGDVTPERHISKSEISLPIPVGAGGEASSGAGTGTAGGSGGGGASDGPRGAGISGPPAPTALPDSGVSSSKPRVEPGSPAIARVAPHRVEIGSPNLRQKPPPRRDANLGLHLPKPPEPPTVEAEYYTIAEFQSSISDGISFRGGQKADVIEKNSGGWWYVQIGETEGWAPCSYIDKRKKPNLSRRTSTLTRPKVPPPAPPVKKQDSAEETSSLCGSSSSKAPESPSRPVYEEPEYDVPAVGFDLESDTDSLKGECSAEARVNGAPHGKYSSPPLGKDSPSVSQKSSPYRAGESLEDICREESIYENDGFRPFSSDEFASARDSSGLDSDSPKGPFSSSSSSPLARNFQRGVSVSVPSSSPGSGGKPLRKVPPDLSRSQSLSRAEETSPRSSSDESGRGGGVFRRQMSARRSGGGAADDDLHSAQSPSARPKPVVRPKPLLSAKSAAEPPSPERMDISTLRRQLRPTGTLRHASLRPGGRGGGGEDSETASVVSSEDSASSSSRSTSDLSSIYSKGSRGGSGGGGDSDPDAGFFFRTTDAYQRAQDSEISFPAGVEVEVLERQESGWWYVRWGHDEGWAPTYFLEPLGRHQQQQHQSVANNNNDTGPDYDCPLVDLSDRGSGGGGSRRSSRGGSKSNSLEKNEQHVQALNNLNQRQRHTPPIPSKPPGGFTRSTSTATGAAPQPCGVGLSNGGSGGNSGIGVRLRNGVRQAAVRPQSVFASPPQPVKDTNMHANTGGSLRRNESMGATDGIRSNTIGVRRNSSFNAVRAQGGSATLDTRSRASTAVAGTCSATTISATIGGGGGGGVGGSATLGLQRNGIPVSTVRPKPIEKSQLIHNTLREVYMSIAEYRGDDETMGFPEGSSLEVLEKNPNGWWYCQVLDGVHNRKGWVPSNYLERKK
ncbi:SH3 and PX domain-containing protein 2A-like [Sardina pilchardus]|uniref:SH3 and PX domain-containing protein 2A-like n=1 Tax=Sardina pilchardus TaxID=27697 RepID=UPI002E105484